MTKKDLKLMASDIIFESEYPKSTKKQLLNFLKEADEIQIKSLILDGKIEEIAEDAIDIVNKRFNNLFENMVKENIEETQEFLTIGREIICEMLESEIVNLDEFKKSIDFVIDEASDYQILSVLMEDKLPGNYDADKEILLIENLNEFAGTTFTLMEGWKDVVKGLQDKSSAYGDKLKSLAGKEDTQSEKLKKWYGSKKREFDNKIKDVVGQRETPKTPGRFMSRGGPKLPRKDYTSKSGDYEELMKKSKEFYSTKHSVKTPIKPDIPSGAKGGLASYGKAVGGLAVAALVIYAGYKIYKNYFSKAARACSSTSDKSACMKQFKNKAVQAQISQLRSGSGKCAKSKDPGKCKGAIQNKINNLQSKIKA